jgi:hypothetical protein
MPPSFPLFSDRFILFCPFTTGAPQFGQNLVPSGISFPQFPQNAILCSLLLPETAGNRYI